MSTFTDVMIDIETTSTKNNACILSIGVVAFNLFSTLDENNINSLELLIDKKSCDDIHLHTCENTMKWWSIQKPEVRKRAFEDGPRLTIKDALVQLSEFCKKIKCKRYWSQGINFDYIVLENAYTQLNLSPVWKFWQLRDSRTIQHMLTDIPSKPEDAHDAISDCKHQIKVIQYVYNKLMPEQMSNSNNTTTFTSTNTSLSSSSSYSSIYNFRKGDWKCSVCNASNFSTRLNCFKCDSFEPEQKIRILKRGDWFCECGLVNYSSRTTCYKCSATKRD
jgi:hypothetical protein